MEKNRYIQIMIDSLKKKTEIMDQLLILNEKQSDIIKANAGLDEFDAIVDQKSALINIINKLDTGFQAVYDRVKPDLTGLPELHKEEIRTIQQLIKELTDKTVKMEASEQRNKQAVEQYFAISKRKIHETKKSVNAASNYYKNMTNTQYVDAQMINFKK